jgi:hypothetical protein
MNRLYFLTAAGILAPIAFGALVDRDRGMVTGVLGAAIVVLVIYFGLGWLYEYLSLTPRKKADRPIMREARGSHLGPRKHVVSPAWCPTPNSSDGSLGAQVSTSSWSAISAGACWTRPARLAGGGGGGEAGRSFKVAQSATAVRLRRLPFGDSTAQSALAVLAPGQARAQQQRRP